MDWPGRITILEDLMRRLSRALADMDARLRRAEQNLQQIGRGSGGGGGGAPPDTLWVEVPAMIPGATGTGFPFVPRAPSQFTTTVRRIKVPYDSDAPIDNIPGATVRWWGNSILYPLESIPVVKAADGVYDARWRSNMAIGTLYIDPIDRGDEPKNGMFQIDNCVLCQQRPPITWPPTYSDPGGSVNAPIGTVWAYRNGNEQPKHGTKVLVHMLPDICLFSIFEQAT